MFRNSQLFQDESSAALLNQVSFASSSSYTRDIAGKYTQTISIRSCVVKTLLSVYNVHCVLRSQQSSTALAETTSRPRLRLPLVTRFHSSAHLVT